MIIFLIHVVQLIGPSRTSTGWMALAAISCTRAYLDHKLTWDAEGIRGSSGADGPKTGSVSGKCFMEPEAARGSLAAYLSIF